MTELGLHASAVPWHNQSVTAIVQYLETDVDRGLLEMEADVQLKTFGRIDLFSLTGLYFRGYWLKSF
jgi:hypothetical protein